MIGVRGECDEISNSCGYNEHAKCTGTMNCPDGWPRHACYCPCHLFG